MSVVAGTPPTPQGLCARCEQPIEGACGDPDAPSAAHVLHVSTCAACGAQHHVACAPRGCARPGCASARPSHPAWTREERALGPWTFVPAPARSVGLRGAFMAAVLLAAAVPQRERLRWAADELLFDLPEVAPWMAYSAVAAAVLVPFAALVAVGLLDHYGHRSVLIDREGLLFDHSPTWHGSRLTWSAIAGFRLVEGGVRLVVRRRPWTRFLGPLVPCDGERQHEVVVLLEGVGVRRFEG